MFLRAIFIMCCKKKNNKIGSKALGGKLVLLFHGVGSFGFVATQATSIMAKCLYIWVRFDKKKFAFYEVLRSSCSK